MQLAIQCKLSDFLPGRNAPLLEMLRNVGVSCLDLEVEMASGLTTTQVEEIKAIFDAQGLRAVTVHIPCWMTGPEWSFQEMGREHALLTLDRAQFLGAETITFVPDPAPPLGTTVAAARRSFEQCIDQLIPEAESRGLHPAFYNPGSYTAAYFGQIQYLKQLCEQYSPRASLTFDIGNWIVAGESIDAAIDRLAPWISVVHIKDWALLSSGAAVSSKARSGIRSFVRHLVSQSPLSGVARAVGRAFKLKRFLPTGTPSPDGTWYEGAVIGDGVLDHRAILSHLKRANFTGYLCIEYEGPENHVSALERGTRVVQSLLRNVLSPVPS